MSFRTKTLSLQRAYFNEGFNGTLENTLRNSFLKLPKAKDQIVEIDLFANQLFAGFEESRNGEGVDTTSAAGELVFHVFGAIAHFERRLISERTKDGLQAARMRGSKPGRPPLKPDTITALQNLVDAGMTAGQAAKQLGIGRSTAYRLIKETT